jgi:NitT/TauT family transport system substrate-binding protein
MFLKNFVRCSYLQATTALLLCFVVLFATACWNQKGNEAASNQSPTLQATTTTSAAPLKITINSWVGWGPLFIAREKGLFDGLNVELNFSEDAGTRRTAMIAGQVDGYASSVDNLAIDATFGVVGKTVLCFDESAGADGIVAKSKVSFANLKGRKVAVQKGLPGHFLLLSVLAKNNLKPTDVTIVDLDADKAGSAFVGGSLDVAVTWEPWISKAAAMSNGKKLITTAELPGLIVDTLVFRDATLKERPEDIRRVIKGWFKALEWYQVHPDEGNQIIGAAYKLKPEEVKGIASGIRFYDLARNREYMGSTAKPGPIYQVFEQASSLWQQANVTTSKVDGRNYINPSYLE